MEQSINSLKNQCSTLGRICIKWGDKKQYNGVMKMYTLGRLRKC